MTLLSLQNSSSFGAIVDGLSALLTIEVGLLSNRLEACLNMQKLWDS